LTVRNPVTGTPITTGVVISAGVTQAVTSGTATVNGTAVDTFTNANNAANTQLLTVTSDGTGSATLTVSGTNSVVTPEVWLEGQDFGGNTDAVLDPFELHANCGTTNFVPVIPATLALTPTTSATIAQSGQRIYTVTATDAEGNPRSAMVNIGFVQGLLSTTPTSARIVWFDIDPAAADQRGAASSSSVSARQSICNRVAGGTYFANSGTLLSTDAGGNAVIRDLSAATKRDEILGTSTSGNFGSFGGFTTTYPKIAARIALPAIGRATFAVCSESANDTFTPVAWQDLEASADLLPQVDEPQAQGGVTTTASPVLTSALVYSQITGTSDVLPASNSAGESGVDPSTKTGLGLEQITFRMRDQSNKGFFSIATQGQTAGSCVSNVPGNCPVNGSNTGQNVIWTIQNTGAANVFIVRYDGAGVLPITVSPGQSVQVQSPILASGTDCAVGGRDIGGTSVWSLGGAGEYGQVDCFDSANIMLNAGAATSATITGTLVSNGAIAGSTTVEWVSALAEPTNAQGVGFTATGTVLHVDENGWNGSVTAPSCQQGNSFNGLYGAYCYYLLQTTTGTIYKINFGGNGSGGAAHTSDTYVYLGTQFTGAPTCNGYAPCSPAGTRTPLTQMFGVLNVGNKVTYTNGLSNTGTGPAIGNAQHTITATQ
jgi:hypothetical protein